ncbi:MAG TPA: hypothetical protein VF541_00140, partial [Longimicrobium sp.]
PIPPAMTEGVHRISPPAQFPGGTDADATLTVPGPLGIRTYIATSGTATVTRLKGSDSMVEFSFDATESAAPGTPGHVHVEGRFHSW